MILPADQAAANRWFRDPDQRTTAEHFALYRTEVEAGIAEWLRTQDGEWPYPQRGHELADAIEAGEHRG